MRAVTAPLGSTYYVRDDNKTAHCFGLDIAGGCIAFAASSAVGIVFPNLLPDPRNPG